MKGSRQNNTSRQGEAVSRNRAALYDAFLALKNREECGAFLRDVCTIAEIDALTERFAIARLISKGISYREAADDTGASTTTVTRVAHWLHHGMGGYPLVLKRLGR